MGSVLSNIRLWRTTKISKSRSRIRYSECREHEQSANLCGAESTSIEFSPTRCCELQFGRDGSMVTGSHRGHTAFPSLQDRAPMFRLEFVDGGDQSKRNCKSSHERTTTCARDTEYFWKVIKNVDDARRLFGQGEI